MNIVTKIGLTVVKCSVSFTVLYCVVLLGIPYFINPDKYKENIFSTIEKETGFKISCEKAEFKKGLSPFLKLNLFHTGVMYPDNTVFLQIKEADLKIKILPLLFKKIEIKNAQLKRPIVNITLYKDFSTSLEKYINDKTKINTNGYVLNKFISSVNSQNYKIKFFDASINRTFYLEGEELHLCDIKLNDSIHVALKGSIFEGQKEYIKYDLDILTVLNTDKQKFSFSPFKTIYDTDVKGYIYGNLKNDKQNNINGNLKISDLSLNLNNVKSENNNAELVFNNNEINFNGLIHTSNKDSAVVKGQFGFGRKRYIDLNTNAKNINLENLLNITSAITKILNIKNPLNDIKVKGLLNADFNIKSDFKKLNSKGNAQIINALLTYKKFQYPVYDINADINFDNNEVNIKKAQANINKNPVNISGKIQHDLTADLTVSSDNIDLKTFNKLFPNIKTIPIDIKKGTLQIKSKINGNLSKELKTKSDIVIKDILLRDKTSINYLNTKKCKINLLSNNNKYNGNITAENIDLYYSGQNVKSTKFDFNFDEKNISIPKNIVILKNSPLMLEGYINNYIKSPSVQINFEGDIASTDIAAIMSKYIKLPYKAEGKLNTNGNAKIENNKIELKTQIKSDRYNYLSYIVLKELLNKPSVTKIITEMDKNTVTLKEISLSDNNSPIIKLSGQIINANEPILKNINFVIPNAVTIASNFFGGEDISLKSDLMLNQSIKNPEIKGNIKIFKYNIKKYLTSIKNADISFSPQNIRFSAPDITVNNSTMNITADVEPDLKNIKISNMQLNSMNLDVNSLFGILHDIRQTNFLINIKNGSATINNFKLLNLKSKDISADFKIDNNILKISDINANAYSGAVSGRMDYDLVGGLLDLDMTGKNLNIRPSLYDLCKYDDNISGKADVKAQASMLTGDYKTVIKSLSGSMEFNARNGSMGTLGKFEYYLYAQNLLYHGLLNATLNSLVQTVSHDDTTHFVKADGKILFQNGKLITDNIHTQGEKMSLFIKGRHNIFTNQSNLDIYGRISDEITKKLGNFADVSISGIVNGQESKKNNILLKVPERITNEIETLYNRPDMKSNMFRVNATGNLKAFNSINSFMWIIPETQTLKTKNDNNENEIEEETNFLPDFSDL